MTVHRLESHGPSPTGWDQLALVIEIDSISNDDLEAGASRLVSGIGDLVTELETNPNRLFPVQFDVKGQARLSERSFWRILSENSEKATELVAEYVDALVATSQTFHHAEQYAAGANAVFSALDVILERNESASPQQLPLYDAFYLYLDKLCDLDHEVYENEYIYRVLPKLCRIDRCRYLKLLYLRMFNGQSAADQTPFYRLHGIFGPKRKLSDAVLMEFIDLAISEGLYEAFQWDVVALLITVVYGSNEAQIGDVWQYIAQKTGDLESDGEPGAPGDHLQYIKWRSDRHMSKLHRKKGSLYSGFHRYDLEHKAWYPI